MNKYKSSSNLCKKIGSSPVVSSSLALGKRIGSLSSVLGKTLLRPSQIKPKVLIHTKPSSRSKENIVSSASSFSNRKINSAQLVNTLKSHIFRPSKELNLILKAIPKYTARKVQDLKKAYKNTEEYDQFATGFLSIFGVLDEELGKELGSLRKKIGEVFTSYLSNSGRFFKLLKNLPNVIKKTEVSNKVLLEAFKTLDHVNKAKLSTNYQDLYEFVLLIINYFENCKKPAGSLSQLRSSREESSMILKDFLGGSCIFNTYDKRELQSNDSRIDTSFSDTSSKPLTCSNKNNMSLQFFDNKPCETKNPAKKNHEIYRIYETPRSISTKSFLKNASNSHQNSTLPSRKSASDLEIKNKIAKAKKNDWEEIRMVKCK